MTSKRASFEQFSIGDHASFSQTFSAEDFESFATLSGDRNPLHHDQRYAEDTEFSRPIVPLHLVLAPLSRIAGMIFPGKPSLYLGHELKSLAPAFYDEPLTYSARIAAINKSHRVLTLSVLAFREKEVVLSANLRVQAREAEWDEPSGVARIRATGRPVTLITGATGAIGSALARRLAKDGHDLLLHGHTNNQALGELARACADLGASTRTFACSLQADAEANRLAQWCASQERWDNVLHAASPGLESDLNDLVSVNYAALTVIAEQFLPCCLRRQSGKLVLVGSRAVESHPTGWDDYVAAKSMAASFVFGFDQKYSEYGIRGLVVAPGYVRSRFSAGHFADSVPAMLPEEVAEKISLCVFGSDSSDPYHIIDLHGTQHGRYGFHTAQVVNGQEKAVGPRERISATTLDPQPSGKDRSAEDNLARLDDTVRSFLGLPPGEDLTQAEMGTTPGWDSLRHIEMLVTIEREFGVNFSSRDIAKTQRYQGIRELLSAGAGQP